MNYSDEFYGTIEKGDAILVTLRDVSFNNGRTWKTAKSIERITPDEVFRGSKSTNGPSESGFTGNSNEIWSGLFVEYCTVFDGRRWRSLK